MILAITTILLTQLTVPAGVGMFEIQNMLQKQVGEINSWSYYNRVGGFRSVAVQSSSQAKARAKVAEKKNPEEKVECGENCLCTKLTEVQVKEILDFIKQQKERQAQFERFRQQNPNGQFPPGGFRGRPQNKQTQPNGVD
jgi:hypothetical protein